MFTMKQIKDFFNSFTNKSEDIDIEQLRHEVKEIYDEMENFNFPSYESRIRMTRSWADYGIMLVNIGEFDKALPIILRSIHLFETDDKITDIWNEKVYINLLFNRAIIYYHTKRKQFAIAELNHLIEKFPDEKLYIDTLYEWKHPVLSLIEIRPLIFWVALILGILLIVQSNTEFWEITGILLILGCIILHQYELWRQRKKEKTTREMRENMEEEQERQVNEPQE